MKAKRPPKIIIPGLKLVVLIVLALILLQFWTTPARDVTFTEPAAFEEIKRDKTRLAS